MSQLLDSIAAQLAGADDEPSTMDGGWNLWGSFGGLVDRVLDFGRLRADVVAKRAMLGEHGQAHRCPNHLEVDVEPCRTLLLLAAPYASHPDFDPAWLVEP
jgi:hypothetical protein